MRSKTLLMTTLRTLREVVAKEETGGGQRSLTLFDASCRLPLVLLLSYAAGNVLSKKKHHHHSSSSFMNKVVQRLCGRVQIHLPQITSYMFVGMLSSASVRRVVRSCCCCCCRCSFFCLSSERAMTTRSPRATTN